MTDRDDGDQRRRDGGDMRQFLDLEISKVLQAKAGAATSKAFEELLIERVKARLKEELGPKIEALAEAAAADFAADLQANLAIEKQIEERARLREEQAEKIDRVFAEDDQDDKGE